MTPPANDGPLRYALFGSSHLFGLIDRYVGPLPDDGFHRAWKAGVPATGAFSLGGVGDWLGEFVLFNTPVAGTAPSFDGQVLYLPPELPHVLSHANADTQVVFSLMRGHEYAIAALVDDPSHGDFSDGVSFCMSGRRWMSLEDATGWVRQFSAPLFATQLAVRQQFPAAQVIHVPPPPPIEDEAHILANPESFGPLFAQFGVKPFEARLRLYRLMVNDMAQRLNAFNIRSLPPPPIALTPAGGLRADFARGCLHGNERYAEGLAAQFREVLTHASL